MIEINLLPKDLQKKRLSFKLDKNIVLVLSGCVALIGVMALYSFVFQAGKYADLEKQLQISKAETAKYASEIVKIDEINQEERTNTGQDVLHSGTRSQSRVLGNLMEDLAGRVPDYVWLSCIKQAPMLPTAPPAARNAPDRRRDYDRRSNRRSRGIHSPSTRWRLSWCRLKKSDYVREYRNRVC